MSWTADHLRGKNNGRLCVVCGAKVTNYNQKVTTCSPLCTEAKTYNISRERAARLFPDIAEREVGALNAISVRRQQKSQASARRKQREETK